MSFEESRKKKGKQYRKEAAKGTKDVRWESSMTEEQAAARKKSIFARERVNKPVLDEKPVRKKLGRREKSNAETSRSKSPAKEWGTQPRTPFDDTRTRGYRHEKQPRRSESRYEKPRTETREERPRKETYAERQGEWGTAPQTPFDEKPRKTHAKRDDAEKKERFTRGERTHKRGRTEQPPRYERSEPAEKPKKKRSGKPRIWDPKARKHTKPEEPKDPLGPHRVQKLISAAGLASRREAEEWIAQGKVQVNGQTIKLGDSATTKDKITVNGAPLTFPKTVYYLMHKPKGYVTTRKDIYGNKTVMDLIDVEENVYPVGRLDKDTTGVLLFTNDGEFANRIMHPRYEVQKTYVAVLDKPFDARHIATAQKGLRLKEGIVRASIRVLSPRKVEVTLHQGYNHVVKRIMKLLGYWVTDLSRTKVGAVTLNIPVGTYRPLTEREVASFH